MSKHDSNIKKITFFKLKIIKRKCMYVCIWNSDVKLVNRISWKVFVAVSPIEKD